MFTDVKRVNNVYPMEARVIPPQPGMAAWTSGSKWRGLTGGKLIQRLETVMLVQQREGEMG